MPQESILGNNGTIFSHSFNDKRSQIIPPEPTSRELQYETELQIPGSTSAEGQSITTT
jgi:hypothetical protein